MATKIAKKQKLEQGVVFTFTDKKATQIEVSLADFPQGIVTELAVHGLSQKLGDSYASLSDPREAIEAVQQVVKNLKAGNFNARTSTGGLIVEAVARIRGISVEQAGELYSALDEDARETLSKKPQVTAMITVIRGERAVAKLDTLADDDLGI